MPIERGLFSRMRARIGSSLAFLFLAWEVTKHLLDWGGRYQVLRDALPHALKIFSEPLFSVVVFLFGVLLILWAHYDIKHSHVEPITRRSPLVSLAMFVLVGALFGSIAGFGIWVWTRAPMSRANNNAATQGEKPSGTTQATPDTTDTKPAKKQSPQDPPQRSATSTPHNKEKTLPADAQVQEIRRRYEVLNRLRDEYVLTHTGVRAGLLERKEYPPQEWINQRLKELGETWRFEDRDKVFRLSRYEALTNQELQDETLKFVAELRAFNNQKKTEDRLAQERLWNERVSAPKEKQHELWQKEQTEYTTRHARLEAAYNEKFRGPALSLCAELRKRVPEPAKTIGNGPRRSILLDHGSFAGPDAIGDATDYLDQLARGLPVK